MPQVYAKPQSQASWMKLPAAKRGFKTYDRYLNWWKSTVAPRFTVADDPFSPIPFGAQKALATQQIQSQINPMIKAFEDSIRRRTQEGTRAIGAAQQGFVQGVEPIAGNIGAAYDTSIQGAQNVNAGLTQFLKDTGGYVASELGKLIPTQDAGGATSAAQQFGTGLAGQQLAAGASTLGQLQASRAAEVGFAEKMPAYARGFGAEAIADLQRQAGLAQEEGLGEIRSQIPGLVSSTWEQLRNTELQKAIAAKGFEFDQQEIDAATTAAATPEPVSQSWRTGPPSQRYVTDPQTGQQYPNPNYRPPAAGSSAASKLDQTGLNTARESAASLHENMMESFRGDLTKGLSPLTKPQRDALLRANRDKVRLQVLADLRTYYPNKPESWVTQQATAILAATGWPAVAAQVSGYTTPAAKPTTPQARQGTQPAKPKPGAKTAAPAKKPPPAFKSPERQAEAEEKASVASAAASEAADKAKGRKEKEARATSALTRYAEGQTRTGRISRGTTRKVVIKGLQSALPGWPYKRIIALADKVMDASYGNTLYGK